MRLATLRQLLVVLKRDTLFEGLYSIIDAEQGGTTQLDHLGFGIDSDLCMLNLTLETRPPTEQEAEQLWSKLPRLPGDLVLFVSNRRAFVSAILVEDTGLRLQLHVDQSGGVPTKKFQQTNALWRFGTSYWDDKMLGVTRSDGAAAVNRIMKEINAEAPFYAPKLYFVWTNRWVCLAPKKFETLFPKLTESDANKPNLVEKTQQDRVTLFRWDAKTLAPLFSPKAESVMTLY